MQLPCECMCVRVGIFLMPAGHGGIAGRERESRRVNGRPNPHPPQRMPAGMIIVAACSLA